MTNFSDYLKQSTAKNNENKNNGKATSKQKEDLEKLIDRYSEYSEDSLMKEFLKLTIEKKSRGELGKGELNKISSMISPMLDESQKQKMKEIIEMVENV